MATPRSEAWNYFKKHETEENKAVCQVEVEAEDGTKKICGRILGVERSCTSALFNHLNRLHSIYPKKIQMPDKSNNKKKSAKTSSRHRPRARTYEDDSNNSEELMDDIVSLVTSGGLPIETVENKSFQRILTKAQRDKKHRTYYKIPEVRTAIREGLETGTVKMNSPVESRSNVKSEVTDDELDLVNEVWLKNSEHSDEYQGESDETNSSDDAPLRPSRPSTSKKNMRESDNLDVELITMLLASSTPFELIDSQSFKKFVRKLNPNYQLPRSKDLKEKIISSVTQTKYF